MEEERLVRGTVVLVEVFVLLDKYNCEGTFFDELSA